MKRLLFLTLMLIFSNSIFAEDEKLDYCTLGGSYVNSIISYSNLGLVTKQECEESFLWSLFSKKHREDYISEGMARSLITDNCYDLEEKVWVRWGYNSEKNLFPEIRCPVLKKAKFLDIVFPEGSDPYSTSGVKKTYCWLRNPFGMATNIGPHYRRMTKQQCIDYVFLNLMQRKFLGNEKSIKSICRRPKNKMIIEWGDTRKEEVLFEINCNVWLKMLEESETPTKNLY